jgi:hypothetical protein
MAVEWIGFTIVIYVVLSVRYGSAQLGIDEVVNVDELRHSLPAPFPAIVLEITYQFLLFVSTEMTGSFAARNAMACALMY